VPPPHDDGETTGDHECRTNHHHPIMVRYGRRIDSANEATARIRTTIGMELRNSRRGAGLSQRVAGGAVGMSHAQVGRIERGKVADPTVGQLARLAAAVGLDLSVRLYPGTDAVRDAAQLRLFGRFRLGLHPALRWRTEVPLPLGGDRRAWDAVIDGDGWRAHVEAETRIGDVQALLRRLALKMRDGGADRVILVVARTRANTATLAAVRSAMTTSFPLAQRVIVTRLQEGADPGGSGIVCI